MLVKIKDYVFDTNLISYYEKTVTAETFYNTPDEYRDYGLHHRDKYAIAKEMELNPFRYGIGIYLNTHETQRFNIPFDSIEERDIYFQKLTELLSGKEII